MKTIKVFIASSEELKEERVLMASLANELSTRLEKVGIQVIAVEWESLDASMNEEHKQEEYNESNLVAFESKSVEEKPAEGEGKNA